MIKKNILRLIGIVASALAISVAASAQDQSFTIQLEEKTFPVGDFTSISVADDFEVTLDKGDCAVKLTVDNALSPYVQVYVRAKTLYIAYDDKSVPKDVKKLYKAKGASQPTFRAVVTVPELATLTLSGNASVNSTAEFPGEFFQLVAGDKTQVKSLNVISTTAAVNLTKNAQAVLSLKSDDKVEITNDGNSNVKLSANTQVLNVTASGNATISIGAEAPSVVVSSVGNAKLAVASKAEKISATSGGNSKVVLSGETETLSVAGEKNAEIDADGLLAKNVVANMAGNSKTSVNASDNITANLVGGSSLYYSGTPGFTIEKIMKSTLAPKGTPAK